MSINISNLNRAIDRVPMSVQRRGHVIRATLTLPAGPGGRLITYRATVSLDRLGDELGWGGFRRRVKRRLKKGVVGKVARGIVKTAKRAAKSKILRAAWKTMPLWANLIPPPAGQTIAAGAAAAQVAMKVAHAAKKGHKAAQEFVQGARDLKRGKLKAVLQTRKVIAATKGLSPAKRALAVRRTLNRHGVYVVRTPTGRTLQIPASKVAV